MKGASQIDYVMAMMIFITVTAVTISLTTDYFLTVSDTAQLIVLRSDAADIMDSLGKPAEPANWESGPDVLGAGGKAYRFAVLVNNTASNYLNAGVTATDLASELVSVYYSSIGMAGIDVNSTSIYDEAGNPVNYSMAGDNVTFLASLSAGEAKWFTVYFNDNSNFTNRSAPVSGANNLSETIYYPEEINLLEYRLIQRLQNSQYGAVKNSTGLKNDFNIEIVNAQINATYILFGDSAPLRGNVISLEKPIVFQNSTAALIRGKLIVRAW